VTKNVIVLQVQRVLGCLYSQVTPRSLFPSPTQISAQQWRSCECSYLGQATALNCTFQSPSTGAGRDAVPEPTGPQTQRDQRYIPDSASVFTPLLCHPANLPISQSRRPHHHLQLLPSRKREQLSSPLTKKKKSPYISCTC
jgi:hypothetical protein